MPYQPFSQTQALGGNPGRHPGIKPIDRCMGAVQAAAVAQWARLARSQRYRTAVQSLRDGLQHDLLEAQSLCRQQAAASSQLQEEAVASQQECQQLLQRLEEAHAFHDNELQVGWWGRREGIAATRSSGWVKLLAGLQ